MADYSYPEHLCDPVRREIAITYFKHEFRKLFWEVDRGEFVKIDDNIDRWFESPELAVPRDFWNGLHGVAMGFKLKIGFIYLVTAENIMWSKVDVPLRDLWFGVELGETTKVIGEGEVSAIELKKYYWSPKRDELRIKQLKQVESIPTRKAHGNKHEIIAMESIKERKKVFSVHDGNRRLSLAVLKGKEKIPAFIGEYTTEIKTPTNYWLPTSILMDNLYFAYHAHKRGDIETFSKYMDILKDMISNSKSGRHELINRALTKKQPFKDDVLDKLSGLAKG